MIVEILTNNVKVIKAEEGKLLHYDGSYCTEAYMSLNSDHTIWQEINEDEKPLEEDNI